MNTTINNILTAFNARIQAKDWLDDTTKKRCEDKVSHVDIQCCVTHLDCQVLAKG